MTRTPRIRTSDPAEAVARAALSAEERRAELAGNRARAVTVIASEEGTVAC